MFHASRRSLTPALLPLLFAALALATAQARAPQTDKDKEPEPPFHEYKGVHLGMTMDDARKALGNPTDKGDKQDFYSFNEKESCQVYYDDAHKVFAVSVTYLGDKSGAPLPKSVLGTEADSKPDGSLYKMLRFPKAGYWVSYTRTPGDDPMTVIAIQKIQ